MPSNLDQAAEAFNDWRSARTKRGHTPENLKALAVSLVGHYPIAHICERLKINTGALKAWRELQKQPVDFVTFAPSSPEPIALKSSASELTLKLTCNGTDLHLTGALEPAFIVSLLNKIKTETH